MYIHTIAYYVYIYITNMRACKDDCGVLFRPWLKTRKRCRPSCLATLKQKSAIVFEGGPSQMTHAPFREAKRRVW